MPAFRHLFIPVFCLLPAGAIAADEDWQVSKATSQVMYTTDLKSWKSLHVGDVVPNRAWISTGPRARVELVRGVESIGFQPNTSASITTVSGMFSSKKTEIVEQIGKLDLEIEKRNQPHTTVQTPYLAAVVKGTIFQVTVGKTKASVTVDRGLVQVRSFASGQQSNIGPHQSATVDSKTGMRVSGELSKPLIISVPSSVAKIAAIGTTTLSGDDTESSDKESDTSTSNGNGNSGNGGNGNGNGGGNSNGNSGNGNGNGGGNGNGNNGNGNGNGGGNGNGNNGNGNGGGNGSNGNGNGQGNSN